MARPTLKTELKIVTVVQSAGWISFYGTNDAAQDLSEFGRVVLMDDYKDKYRLEVDARYDLNEVVAYINNYENETS